jgi:hypothetical protein
MVENVQAKVAAIDARINLLSSRANGMNGNIIKKLQRQKRNLLAKNQ